MIRIAMDKDASGVYCTYWLANGQHTTHPDTVPFTPTERKTMDPDATLQRIEDALKRGDLAELLSAAADLSYWLNVKRGYRPVWSDYKRAATAFVAVSVMANGRDTASKLDKAAELYSSWVFEDRMIDGGSI